MSINEHMHHQVQLFSNVEQDYSLLNHWASYHARKDRKVFLGQPKKHISSMLIFTRIVLQFLLACGIIWTMQTHWSNQQSSRKARKKSIVSHVARLPWPLKIRVIGKMHTTKVVTANVIITMIMDIMTATIMMIITMISVNTISIRMGRINTNNISAPQKKSWCNSQDVTLKMLRYNNPHIKRQK